jgi:hypothetical protein
MYILALLLALTATTLAIPVSSSALTPRGGLDHPNYCAANLRHYPTAEEYTLGYTQFCNNHAPAEIHRKSDGLTMTLTLTGYDKKPIAWVFKVSIDDNMPGPDDTKDYSFTLTQDICKDKFGSFLTGAGGGMPGVYCEWDYQIFGQGFRMPLGHLMIGGKFQESLGQSQFGDAVYETRVKKGEKGIPY